MQKDPLKQIFNKTKERIRVRFFNQEFLFLLNKKKKKESESKIKIQRQKLFLVIQELNQLNKHSIKAKFISKDAKEFKMILMEG